MGGSTKQDPPYEKPIARSGTPAQRPCNMGARIEGTHGAFDAFIHHAAGSYAEHDASRRTKFLERRLGRYFSRGSARARPRARARRLSRNSGKRGWSTVRRQLGCVSPHASRTSMPRARLALYLPGTHSRSDHGRDRSRHPDSRRHQTLSEHLRTGANDLAGWPSASTGRGAAYLDGVLNRRVAGPRAQGAYDTHQAGMASAQRYPDEREGHDDGVLHPPR